MKEIQLTQGRVALVDDEDYGVLMRWRWQYSTRGYAVHSTSCDGKKLKLPMHRFLMCPDRSQVVDHIDGNPLNNQRANLRVVSRAVNNQNSVRANKTGYRGVHFCLATGAYRAEVYFQGVKQFLGSFPTPIEAARAYDAMALELYGPDAMTNEKLLKEMLSALKK